MLRIPCVKTTYFIALLFLMGCGFHLRGAYPVPDSLKTLQITPQQPYNDFQRALKPLLRGNGIRLVDQNTPDIDLKQISTLSLLSETFSEKTISYGSDGQANRAVLQFKVDYQLINNDKPFSNNTTVIVTRELTIDPNNFLATENERIRLRTDLYLDAASQLIRQLSALTHPKHKKDP